MRTGAAPQVMAALRTDSWNLTAALALLGLSAP